MKLYSSFGHKVPAGSNDYHQVKLPVLLTEYSMSIPFWRQCNCFICQFIIIIIIIIIMFSNNFTKKNTSQKHYITK